MTGPLGPRPEWGDVAVWCDLRAEAERLVYLSHLLGEELTHHPHPAARALIGYAAEECLMWAEEAQMARDNPDTLDRRAALTAAQARRQAAQRALRRWVDIGDLWNAHREGHHRPALYAV